MADLFSGKLTLGGSFCLPSEGAMRHLLRVGEAVIAPTIPESPPPALRTRPPPNPTSIETPGTPIIMPIAAGANAPDIARQAVTEPGLGVVALVRLILVRIIHCDLSWGLGTSTRPSQVVPVLHLRYLLKALHLLDLPTRENQSPSCTR
jgi:hypothetical protein